MTLPFFSIIIPVYNRDKIVGKSIDSVLNQSFKNFEIVLVDDKSDDNCLEVLEAYANKYEQITLVKSPVNQGRCAARNSGIAHAKSSWICYLDSDDSYFDNHLSTLYDLIQKHPNYKVFCTDQLINNIQKEYLNKNLLNDLTDLTFEDFIESNPLTANQVCHQKDIDVTWSKERHPISEDWLFHRQLSRKYKILKTNIATNNILEHSERSVNLVAVDAFVKWNLKGAEKFIREEKNLEQKYANRIMAYTLILCTNIYLKDGNKKEALTLFKQSLKYKKTYTYLLLYKAVVKFLL